MNMRIAAEPKLKIVREDRVSGAIYPVETGLSVSKRAYAEHYANVETQKNAPHGDIYAVMDDISV